MRKYFWICLIPSLAFAQDYSIEPDAQARIVEDAVNVILKQVDAFQFQSHELSQAAEEFCQGEGELGALKSSLLETRKAWEAIDAYQFGPIEQSGAALYVNFWPDKKGFVEEHLSQIDALDEEAQKTVAGIASLSAAAQGLPAAEALIYERDNPCPAIIGVSANISYFGDLISEGWNGEEGWGELMLNAGDDNPVYHTPAEALSEIYDALLFGIERVEMKLKEPLGDEGRPLPKRAEAWRSGQSSALLVAQLAALKTLVSEGFPRKVFQPDRIWVEDKFDDAIMRVEAIELPISEAVEDINGRFQVEAAWTRVDYLKDQVNENIGAYLGVAPGFTPADGD